MSKNELVTLRLSTPSVAPDATTVRGTARRLTVAPGVSREAAEGHARALGAMTTWTYAEAEYFEALDKAFSSYSKTLRTAMELNELPEKYAHERAVRRVLRANELRQAQQMCEVHELQRLTEIAHRETELTDARQQLAAQRNYGESTHELAWKKKHLEMLEIEMDAVERRALLKQHHVSLEAPSETAEKRLERQIQEEIDAILQPTPRR